MVSPLGGGGGGARRSEYEQLMRGASGRAASANWKMEDDSEPSGEAARHRGRNQQQDEASADASAEFQLMSRSASGRFEAVSTGRDGCATWRRQRREPHRLHNLSKGDGAQASGACRASSTMNRAGRLVSADGQHAELEKMESKHQQQAAAMARYNSNGLYSQPASGQPSLSSTNSQHNITGTATTSSSAIDDQLANEYLEPARVRPNCEALMLDERHQRHPDQMASLGLAPGDMEAQRGDSSEEHNFYCDVTSESLRRAHEGRQRVLYEPQVRPSHVKQQQQQQQQQQHQQNLLFSTTHRPNPAYKRPATLTLNQSYQRLVEKLNEGAVHPRPSACELFRRDEPLYQANIYTQAPYYADQTSLEPSQPQMGTFFFPNQLGAPVFESSMGRARKCSSNSSENYQQPPSLRKQPFRRPPELSSWVRCSVLLLCGLLLLLALIALVVPIYTQISYWASGANSDPSGQLMKAPAPPPDGFYQNLSRAPAVFPFGPKQPPNGLHSPPIGSEVDPLDLVPMSIQPPGSVIKQAQQTNSITSDEMAKWPPFATVASSSASSSSSSGGGASTTPPASSQLEASTQSYWGARARKLEADEREVGGGASFCAPPRACSGHGQCLEAAVCACLAGHSGPTCSNVDCPNGCSRRGECKLLASWPLNNLAAHRDASLGFQSTSSAKWRLSSCAAGAPADSPRLTNRSVGLSGVSSWSSRAAPLFDQRLQWACQCEAGFTGADCSRALELSCSDKLDNDHDGHTDCEDEDCCGHPACREQSSCIIPSDWHRALLLARAPAERQLDELLAAPNASSPLGAHLLAAWNFLIGANSTQRYAKRDVFDPRRVAIVRGRVINGAQQSFRAGVRVGVAEVGEFGFTLSYEDGNFDLLVNGDAWLTLQFNSQLYSYKRRVFVRPRAINLLDEEVLMEAGERRQLPASGEPEIESRPRAPFQLGPNFELYKLIEQFKQPEQDERRRAQLFFCLTENLIKPARVAAQNSPLIGALEPRILLDTQQPSALRPFALISAAATSFSAKLSASPAESAPQLVYNSANFPPASSMVKPTVSIELLPGSFSQLAQASNNFQLASITLQLDIEGHLRRQHFDESQLVDGLSYQFAWNRRDIYERKIYGFGQLNVRLEYEYKFGPQSGQQARRKIDETLRLCSTGQSGESDELRQSLGALAAEFGRRLVVHEARLHMEAHQMNQHADLGHWALESGARLDLARNLIYFGAGPTLPLTHAYPPVVSEQIDLVASSRAAPSVPMLRRSAEMAEEGYGGKRLMARGPESTMFVVLSRSDGSPKSSRLVLLDASGTRRLLDVPLSALTGKFQPLGEPASIWTQDDDLQLVYNRLDSTLYISSRLSAKIVQVSLQSLKTLELSQLSPTMGPEDDISIEPLCGFGRQLAGAPPAAGPLRACKSTRLARPHSMTLDERNRLLYFVDGTNSLHVLDLATNLALNLASILPAQSVDGNVGGQSEERGRDSEANCLGPGARLPPADILISANKLHSLVWSGADSSLYMVLEDSVVLALRPDANFEIVALGANSANYKISSPAFLDQVAAPKAFHFCAPTSLQLGAIKTIELDDTHGHELIIVHQWLPQQTSTVKARLSDEPAKRAALFYLAKVPLGIRSESQAHRAKMWPTRRARTLLDLHSAQASWNPLIGQFAPISNSTPIDWHQLAKSPSRLEQMKNYQTGGATRSLEAGDIRFLHLSGGFARLDSLQINSDGSIFVLDARHQSIHLIGAYSPSQFNLLDRSEWGLERLFAIGDRVPVPSERPLSRLLLPNPLQSNQLLEFHYKSGLLLSRSQLDHGARTDFFYRIFTNAAHKADGQRPLDEDDANDLESKRLAFELLNQTGQSNRQAQATAALNSLIRLNRLEMHSRRPDDDPKIGIEFVRAFTGSRFVLQSIKRNHKLISEITTDRLGSLTTFIGEPNTRINWTELVYDPKTYLLQNVITKSTTRNPASAQPSAMMLSFNDDKLERSTKRVIYDEVFNHYCDLFTVGA